MTGRVNDCEYVSCLGIQVYENKHRPKNNIVGSFKEYHIFTVRHRQFFK